MPRGRPKRPRSLDEQPSQLFRLLRLACQPDMRTAPAEAFAAFGDWVRNSDRRLDVLEIAVTTRTEAQTAGGILERAEQLSELVRSRTW